MQVYQTKGRRLGYRRLQPNSLVIIPLLLKHLGLARLRLATHIRLAHGLVGETHFSHDVRKIGVSALFSIFPQRDLHDFLCQINDAAVIGFRRAATKDVLSGLLLEASDLRLSQLKPLDRHLRLDEPERLEPRRGLEVFVAARDDSDFDFLLRGWRWNVPQHKREQDLYQ